MRWLLACFLCLTALPAFAETPFYGELQLSAGGVRHSDLQFYPVFGTLSAGAWVYPGIGIEAFADTGLMTGEEDDFELELTTATGLMARFQSPPSDGLSGYILLGYVNFTLEQKESSERRSGTDKETFSGARISIGMVQRLTRLPNLLVSVEYRNYYVDEDIRVDGLSLGLRVNIQ